MGFDCTPKEEEFCQAYVKVRNPARAYFKVAGGEDTPWSVCESRGLALMRKPNIRIRIRELREELQELKASAEKITVPEVLKQFLLLANADPNEIISLRVGCCRYCHGDGHQYQYTPNEYQRAFAQWEALDPALQRLQGPPSVAGGLEFDKTRPPKDDCPECGGEGIERAVARDTTDLSPGAALLYQGVKVTKDGLQIQMADRVKALENVARILGAYKDSVALDANVKAAVQAVHQAVNNPEDAQRVYMAMIANDAPAR